MPSDLTPDLQEQDQVFDQHNGKNRAYSMHWGGLGLLNRYYITSSLFLISLIEYLNVA